MAIDEFDRREKGPSAKAVLKGALEEAVALFDELSAICRTIGGVIPDRPDFLDLQRRRAALEPRLAKRRCNSGRGYQEGEGTVDIRRRTDQAKPRPNAEAVAERIWDATIGRKAGTTTAEIKEAARRRKNQGNVCGKRCDHGGECLLLVDHEPLDRHESDHGCVFYDPPRRDDQAKVQGGKS